MHIPEETIKRAESLNVSVMAESHQPGGLYRGVAIENIGNTRYAETAKADYPTQEDAFTAVLDLVEKKGRPLTPIEQLAAMNEIKKDAAAKDEKIATLQAEIERLKKNK